MNGKPCRFVNDQKVGLITQDTGLKGLAELFPRYWHRGLFRRCIGGNTDGVAGLKPCVGLGAFLVDSHLTTPYQAIDARAGNAFQLAQQEIVETLAHLAGFDFHEPDFVIDNIACDHAASGAGNPLSATRKTAFYINQQRELVYNPLLFQTS